MTNPELSERLKEVIRNVPNFPKPGILFRDITTLVGNGGVFRQSIYDLAGKFRGKIDSVAMFDARGFIFGGALLLADEELRGGILLRKPRKLPGEVDEQGYELEYGTDYLQIARGSVIPGERVLLLDDLCATGGTGLCGADLGGSSRIKERGIEFYSQVSYGGD